MPDSYLYLNGLRVHYLYWNLAGEGHPVIFLHGLASNARIWEKVAPVLAEENFRLYAPDVRGHGLTDKPDGNYDFDTLRADLSAFIETCNLERPLLVGHSWGASLALDYASQISAGARAPCGIFLVDGGMIQMDAVPGATWESTRERLAPPRLAGTPLSQFLKRFTDNQRAWQPDDQSISIILANFEIDENEAIYPRLKFENHMQIVRAMWEFQTYQRFKQVRCPVCMLAAIPPQPWGAQEAAYVSMKQSGAQVAQEQISKLQIHWMTDTIHDVPLQRPEQLSRLLIDFAFLCSPRAATA